MTRVPLLHPNLFWMVELAKGAGCQVGQATNGVLLSQEMSRGLALLGMDLIAVSIAGGTPSNQAALRKGSELQRIVANVAGLARERRRSGSSRPRIVLMHMMPRSNVAELPLVVELAGRSGRRSWRPPTRTMW